MGPLILLGCHPGRARTLSSLKRKFWWLTMDKDVREFVVACSVCAKGRSSHPPPAVTIVDQFSKAAHFVPLNKLPTATKTAQLLVLHVFRMHGIPSDVVSDRGSQFTSGVWKAFCQVLGASESLSSEYHPQTNCPLCSIPPQSLSAEVESGPGDPESTS